MRSLKSTCKMMRSDCPAPEEADRHGVAQEHEAPEGEEPAHAAGRHILLRSTCPVMEILHAGGQLLCWSCWHAMAWRLHALAWKGKESGQASAQAQCRAGHRPPRVGREADDPVDERAPDQALHEGVGQAHDRRRQRKGPLRACEKSGRFLQPCSRMQTILASLQWRALWWRAAWEGGKNCLKV